MTPKKRPVEKEPFLNAIARKLGHAAGTLTHVAQGLTDTLSVAPKDASTRKNRKAASDAAGRLESKKRTGEGASRRPKKRIAGPAKRTAVASKLRGRTASNSRTKK